LLAGLGRGVGCGAEDRHCCEEKYQGEPAHECSFVALFVGTS
jgi:hypothetical protein